jgi:UDP-N-acetylmuramate dehydrogenase
MRSFSMSNKELQEIFDKGLFRGEVRYNEPLSDHTSLKIGGPVDVMVFPEDPMSLKNILMTANREGIPLYIIGAGTNLLVGDDRLRGVAISLKEFKKIELTRSDDDERVVLYVGSGAPLAALIHYAQKEGYTGIEALAGIPGSFGGAVSMNAGSFGTEIKDVLVSVAVMNISGELTIIEKERLNFTYRNSNIPGDSIILSANVSLQKDDPDEVKKRTKEFMARKKETQPLGVLSAGCVFKNPEGSSAGKLIDEAGCKGLQIGTVEVSSVHANYIVNRGQATCRDFVSLMDTVKEKVREHCGIELEPEIRIMGKDEEK